MNDEQTNNQEVTMTKLPASSQKDQLLQRAEAESIEFMNPKRWEIMHIIANTFQQSGALPATINTTPKLMMVLQAGFEAGLKPIEAINSFYFVNGRLAMYGDTCISQVKRAGHKVQWLNCDAMEATCKITRGDNGDSLESTFTIEMAKERGMATKDVWKKYPENMLKFKAFHATAKFICPEALHGVPMKEELEEVAPNEMTVISAEESEIKFGKFGRSEAATERPSLEEAINAQEAEDMKEQRPCCGGKTKHLKSCATNKTKEEPVATEDVAVEAKKTEKVDESRAAKLMKQGMGEVNKSETPDEKYNRLIKEGEDRRLTPEEAKFITEEYPKFKESGVLPKPVTSALL